MIQTFDELIINSGPWCAEFGEYERVLNKEITNEECEILDKASSQIQVLRCKLRNIDCSKLKNNTHYLLHREGKAETWLYEGLGKIDSSYCIFTRPSDIYEKKINEQYKYNTTY